MKAVPTAPTDYITTFVRHVEQDMRQQVKRHLHDEFMHDVQNLLWAFKKKPVYLCGFTHLAQL